MMHSTPPQSTLTYNNMNSTNNNNNIALLWGATGEQEWTPALTTGLLCPQTFFMFIKSLANH